METKELNHRLTTIFGEQIELLELENQEAKKWYEKRYTNADAEFKENFIYGVKIDNIIQFDIKVAKFENIMRSFCTNYIKKYVATKHILLNGEYVQMGVEKAKDFVRTRMEGIRLEKYLTYSTNYGIGVWIIFIGENELQKCINTVSEVLIKNKIEYKNEYSDARWVYRFVFDGNYLDHNNIIEQINFTDK